MISTLIILLAILLGGLAPYLLFFALSNGIRRSNLSEDEKSISRRYIFFTILIWTITVWISTLSNVFAYHPGDDFPRFLAPLMIPVFGAIIFLIKENYKKVIDSIPLSILTGVQAFRILGVLFIVVVYAGQAPNDFMVGGFGDITVGVLAIMGALMLKNNIRGAKLITWIFSLVGLIDLLSVAYLLLLYYPIWYNEVPSSASSFEFPLMLVIGLAAPVALILHFYAVRNLLLSKSN